MGYKHIHDTLYTHFQGINNDIYGFGRHFFLCSFIFVTSPPIFLPVHICFTRPNDGWMGLYIKLCQNGKLGINISGHLAELTDPDNINDTTCCNSHSRSNSEVQLVFGRKGRHSSAACCPASARHANISQCGDGKNHDGWHIAANGLSILQQKIVQLVQFESQMPEIRCCRPENVIINYV